MEKLNIPDPILERTAGSHAVHLLSREEALSILPHLDAALCDGNGAWSKAQHRDIEDHDAVEFSIKFKIRSDAL
jgi:hypothetical protein